MQNSKKGRDIVKKICVSPLILLLLLAFPIISVANSAHTWQQSSHPIFEIGIRDKYGNFNNASYTANFVVYAPKGKTYYYSAKGSNDEWVYSIVPDDYKGLLLNPGDYSWQCYVDDEVAASGGFRVTQEGGRRSITTL